MVQQTFFAERLHHLTYTPVNLHHDVAEESLLAFPLELVGNGQRYMWHGMRQINEERCLTVLLDESHRPIRVIGRKPALVRVVAHYLVAVIRW